MKNKMTPRERFLLSLSHQEPDRVPIDLAGTSLTGIGEPLLEKLKTALGIEGPPVTVYRHMDERILEALGVDFRRVGDLIGAGDRLLPGQNKMIDMWGIERTWTGLYWDIIKPPLKGAELGDLEVYPWPKPSEWINEVSLAEYREDARQLWEETDYVVVAEHPVYGVFELACWMCGFDDFLWRLAGDRPFVHRLFSILVGLQKQFIEPYYGAVGDFIHLTTSGDDFGMQTGPFLSPKVFRETIKPYFADRIAFTRQFTQAAFWHHSCGSIYQLLPDLIECGVEILNPIQPGAAMMEPERLKRDFGSQICFHGGFDTQQALPFGTQDEVEAEVERVMDALKPGGGFIFSAAHNIQEDVPVENILAMFRAAKAFGKYDVEENNS